MTTVLINDREVEIDEEVKFGKQVSVEGVDYVCIGIKTGKFGVFYYLERQI